MNQTEKVREHTHGQAASLTDMEIIEQVLDGHVEAFEKIIRRYNQRLYRLARGIVGDDQQARDVLQESYLKAYLNLPKFRGPDGFPSWLHVITRNQAFAALRSTRQEISMESNEMEKSQNSGERHVMPDPHVALETRRLGIALERAIDKLPATFRAVFVLRAIDGLSVKETALVLGIREPTVKTRFYRARQILQLRLHGTQQAALSAVYEFAGVRCDTLTAAAMQKIRHTNLSTHQQ